MHVNSCMKCWKMLSLKINNRANIYVPTAQVKNYSYDTFSHLINAYLLSAYFVSRIWGCIMMIEISPSLHKTAHYHLIGKKETG